MSVAYIMCPPPELPPGWSLIQSTVTLTTGRGHCDGELTRLVCMFAGYVFDDEFRVRNTAGEFLAESISMLTEKLVAAEVLVSTEDDADSRTVVWSEFEFLKTTLFPIGWDFPHVPHAPCVEFCDCPDRD